MERRVFFLCLLSFLMFAEGLSWLTAGGLGPCLVKPEHSQQATDDNKHQDCPTFFAGTLLSFERGFEWVKRDDNDKAVVAGFTVVLAISTIGLWLATNRLWSAGERQLELLAKTAASQSRDMQASVKVATRSAEVAERTMILNDRPWVAVDIELAGPLIFTEEKCSIDIKYAIKNVGRSPAIKAGIFIEFVPAGSIVDRHIRLTAVADMTAEQVSFGSTLFPNGTHEMTSTFSINRSTIEDEIQKDERHEFRPSIVACAYYGLPTGGRFRRTSVNYEITQAGDDPEKAIDTAPGQIEPHELVLLNMMFGTTT
jgi:hypothetical protein